MLEGVKIEMELVWIESDGDTSLCSVCQEPIFGRMQVLTIIVGEKKEPTKIRACQSCFEFQK